MMTYLPVSIDMVHSVTKLNKFERRLTSGFIIFQETLLLVKAI